jgi:hypothetical protein
MPLRAPGAKWFWEDGMYWIRLDRLQKSMQTPQSLKIFWSKASLGLRRGVVVGKIGMATSHLAVER